MSITIDNVEYAPGSFATEYIKIRNDMGEVDITMLWEEITITESLWGNGIQGSITMTDALNLMGNLPISEGDVLDVYLHCNERDDMQWEVDGEEIDTMFEITRIAIQRKVKQDVQVYVIHFAGDGWSENLYTRVSKSFKKKKYTEMVQEIYDETMNKGGLKGLMEGKDLIVEPSDIEWNAICPGWKPWKFFNFCAMRSFLGDWCDYVFWEDIDNWHLKPISKLIEKGPVDTYYSTVGNMSPATIDFTPHYFHIEQYEFKDNLDVALSGLVGMKGHHMIKHDMYNKRIVDYHPSGPFGENWDEDEPFSYEEDFGKYEHVDGGIELLSRPEVIQKFVDSPGNSRYSIFADHPYQWDDFENGWQPNLWLRQHESQLHTRKYLRMEADVIGNFRRRVGDVIEIKLMSPEWKEKSSTYVVYDTPTPEPRLKGNWLITTLRRVFHRNAKYHLKMELIKDEFASYKIEPIWEAAVEHDNGR